MTRKSGAPAAPGERPTVSVVMPAYNAEATLAESVASLCAQEWSAWELVIVNDGSTDATGANAARLAAEDPRIMVVDQANAGEAAARNTGLRRASGEWLLFLDADDWIAPNHLARLVRELSADPSLDAVHCGWARVAADGSVVTEDYEPPTGDMFATWARRSAFPVHACLVRRELVTSVGGFDETLRKSADWDMWQRVARTGARFGAVRETLAFYRMSPAAASLEAEQMLADGLRVLRQGHAPDPRVARPAVAHAAGRPASDVPTQAFYLLAWCAGLMLGRDEDPRPLLEQLTGMVFPALHPESVARCLFDAAPLPSRQPPVTWERLWPRTQVQARTFLEALEVHAQAPGLAARAHTALATLALAHAPSWQPAAAALHQAEARAAELGRARVRAEATLEHERADQKAALDALREDARAAQRESDEAIEAERQRHKAELAQERSAAATARLTWEAEAAASREQLATLRRDLDVMRRETEALEGQLAEAQLDSGMMRAELEGQIQDSAACVEDLEHRLEASEALASDLTRRLQLAEARATAVEQSPERRLGDFLLHRLRLAVVGRWLHAAATVTRQQCTLLRLRVDRWMTPRGTPRLLASVCTEFPIYSQTFVHQELEQLEANGFAVRVGYSIGAPRTALGGRFERLWGARRALCQHRPMQRRHFLHYARRQPVVVERLLDRLSEAARIPVEALRDHDNVLEGFTYARMAEAYRAEYLHSYFFYDRSLMALITGELLGLPRGITCYADHLLDDYELKVVPLHLATANIVVATSARIKRELLALAPATDPDRILVKPNGIDATRFPVRARLDPAVGQPSRLVTVCRIEPKKGLIELVDAVALLRDRGVLIEAHVIGGVDEWSTASREYKATLDARIGALGLWGTVHLEGRQDLAGISRFLDLAQLFVAPFVETATGDKDGIPTALLEGMATGLPVVASRAGSIEEVVRDGEEGLLVRQRDPAALAEAIAELLAAPDRRRRMGEAAARRVRSQFDVATCEAEFQFQIRSVLGARR